MRALLRLSFRDPEQERAFRAAFGADLATLGRITTVVFAGLCLIAGFVHPADASAFGWPAATLSFAVALPLAFAGMAAARAPVPEPLREIAVGALYAGAYASAAVAFVYLLDRPGGAGLYAAPFAVVLAALMTVGGFTFLGAALLGAVLAAVPVGLTLAFSGADPFALAAFAMAYVLGLSATLLSERLKRGQFKADRAVAHETARIEGLLFSVLPEFAATRLKAGETRIAQGFQDIGVLFADLAGFTAMSGRLGAAKTVEVLDDVFGAFDDACARLGVERVKTIGDGYMAVASRNRTSPNDLRPLADLALEIRRLTELAAIRSDLPIAVRIGLHCGPAIGGVIGRRRPQFDYWGTTINVASRLEGAAKPGEIVVSPQAYARLKGTFAFEPAGGATLKGVGAVELFRLTGRLAVARAGA